jgi:hypothetical protein
MRPKQSNQQPKQTRFCAGQARSGSARSSRLWSKRPERATLTLLGSFAPGSLSIRQATSRSTWESSGRSCARSSSNDYLPRSRKKRADPKPASESPLALTRHMCQGGDPSAIALKNLLHLVGVKHVSNHRVAPVASTVRIWFRSLRLRFPALRKMGGNDSSDDGSQERSALTRT